MDRRVFLCRRPFLRALLRVMTGVTSSLIRNATFLQGLETSSLLSMTRQGYCGLLSGAYTQIHKSYILLTTDISSSSPHPLPFTEIPALNRESILLLRGLDGRFSSYLHSLRLSPFARFRSNF